MWKLCAAVVLFTLVVPVPRTTVQAQQRAAVRKAGATQEIDPRIASAIASIQAVDNHAHPMLPPAVDSSDRGFDALPVDNMAPQTDPVALRPENPELRHAWHALWNFDGTPPLDAGRMAALDKARGAVRHREGRGYARWVLGRAGIQTMIANRVAMGTGLEPPLDASPGFVWVPYVDALLFPLRNDNIANTPDRKSFFQLEEKLRQSYLMAVGLSAPPASLDGYLRQVVTPTLERQYRQGAVAEKFEIAYLRSFGFEPIEETSVTRVYADWVSSGKVPPDGEYRQLQDFLFRYIARECGRLGMPVHLHSMTGAGSYFDTGGADPARLESVFNDASLRGTRFVMLHGGWPYVETATALLQKPNVWLDVSQESLMFSARTIAGWLRLQLETYPDKVLFGTDGYPYAPWLGWEESAWIASHKLRRALGIALTEMLRDGEIDLARAEMLAREVLSENAKRLYGTRLSGRSLN